MQLPAAATTLPAQPAAITPRQTGTKAISATTIAIGEGKQSCEAPAYEGTGRAPDGALSQQKGAERSSPHPNTSGRASLELELEGGDGGTRQSTGLLLPQEGDDAAVATHAERGDAGVPAALSRKARPRANRKPHGDVWTSGAGATADKDVRGRAPPPPPTPGTDVNRGSRRRSPGSQRGDAGDAGLLPPETTEKGCDWRRPGESSSASRAGRTNEDASAVSQSNGSSGKLSMREDFAPSRTILAASLHDRRPGAAGQLGGESSTQGGSCAHGGGGGSSKRRHTFEGPFDGDIAADAGGSLPASSRPKKKTLSAKPAPPSTPSGPVGGGREEAASSSPQVSGRFRFGSSPSAPTPGGGASAATEARHSQPQPKGAPVSNNAPATASGLVTAAAERTPARLPVSPSQYQDGVTSARPGVEVPRPALSAEGGWHDQPVTGQKRSPDRDRARGEEEEEEEGERGVRAEERSEDNAMDGRCPKLSVGFDVCVCVLAVHKVNSRTMQVGLPKMYTMRGQNYTMAGARTLAEGVTLGWRFGSCLSTAVVSGLRVSSS